MSIASKEMTEPVERFFEREFPAQASLFLGLEQDEKRDANGPADLAYIQGGKESLHALCVATSYSESLTDIHKGIHATSSLEANFCWLVLPLDEFRQGDGMCNGLLESLCEERGVGLITVQPSGMGLSAKAILKPKRRAGRYLNSYDGLPKQWRESARSI